MPPLLALIAASAEVNAARSAPVDSLGLRSNRQSLASLAGLRSAGDGAVRALAWAAGMPHLAVTQAPMHDLLGQLLRMRTLPFTIVAFLEEPLLVVYMHS